MIYWAGILVIKDRKVLMVREVGKSFFALPGGSREDQEATIETLKREIKEEISVELDFPLESFLETELPGKDKNEMVHFTVYKVDAKYVDDNIVIGKDIEEFKWLNYKVMDMEKVEIGAITKKVIFPDLRSRNLID